MGTYDGFYQLAESEDPLAVGKYTKRSDGTVVVPVADALGGAFHDADTGIRVEETNYEELSKSPDYTKLADVLGKKGTAEEVMERVAEIQKEAKEAPAPKNPTQYTESNVRDSGRKTEASDVRTIQVEGLPERTHEVVWDTPMGQFSVLYRAVLVSKSCIVLVNKPEDKPRFTPVLSSKNNPIIYTVTYKGVQYQGLFLGVSAKDSLMDVIALNVTESTKV